MGNVGRWNNWYAGMTEPAAYGDTTTYQLGADWLADCALVEDWGCGKGWLSTLIPPNRYRGVDGSATPFAHVTADLAEYQSAVPGVFLRHVLEHDRRWAQILDNAVATAQERLVVILFTPLAETTHEIAWNASLGVPDIAFRLADVTGRIEAGGMVCETETLPTNTQYGQETILRCTR